jgi:hypothetical protein
LLHSSDDLEKHPNLAAELFSVVKALYSRQAYQNALDLCVSLQVKTYLVKLNILAGSQDVV